MRRVSVAEIPKSFAPGGGQRVQKEFHFQLITPMFGGGATSWQLDKKEPVRAQAVKGQLRFWWRTMQNESDPRKLLEAENRLWGGKSGEDRTKSSVEIAVVEHDSVSIVNVAPNDNRNGLGNNILSNYVLFPVTQNVKNGEQIPLVKDGAKFILLVSCNSEDENVVLDTLKLWALFGGVGARTRRGCGSLHSPELLGEFSTPASVMTFLKRFQGDTASSNYPRLKGSKLYIRSDTSAGIKGYLTEYSQYRQLRRNGKPPGRSYWPEPDAIRAITRESSATHRNPVNNENWFPKAAFGLPILTKFNTDGDPGRKKPIELKPVEGERWPSPMILKSIKLGNNIHNIMLVLNHRIPNRMQLGNHNVPENMNPTNTQNKRMIIGAGNEFELKGRTIYKALADHLEMEELHG